MNAYFVKVISRRPLSQHPEAEPVKYVCSHVLMCCDGLGYVETVRDVFALAEKTGFSQEKVAEEFFFSIMRLAERLHMLGRCRSGVNTKAVVTFHF